MIIIKNEGVVRVISLNDQASLNSLSEALSRSLCAALEEAVNDTDVKAVVLTAEGKFFSTGGNLKDFQSVQGDRGDYVARVMDDIYHPLTRLLSEYPLPLVVAMNGPAIGAGVGLAINADFILASEEVYFTLPFVPRLGIVPDMGSSWLLVQALGYRKALALCLTGEKLSAQEALQCGLIHQLCEADDVLPRAIDLVAQLAQLPQEAVLRTKRLLRSAASSELADHLALERELQIRCFQEPDFEQALAAFTRKA